jgi:Tol biopolymer transport system component
MEERLRALTPGLRLGPYEITGAIGAGGMGEVYKARDTRLDRTVAIKVLSTALTADPQLRDRVHREARAISRLDHPNICALYDVGEDRGITFLVMQYLEGESLADRLRKGPIPIDDVLAYAIQISGALDSAHRAGIIHRDLKPGNIMLTKGGARLLDFGLAKIRPAGAGVVSNASATRTMPLTEQGSVIGTLPYMAPEQLQGKESDHRVDIWAFGCVVYEMLAGRRAFAGETGADLVSAIMSSEPLPIGQTQPVAGPVLERVVRTCVAKSPDDRWQSATDLTRELRWIAESGATVVSGEGRARARGKLWLGWIVGALGLLAAAARFWPTAPQAQTTRFVMTLPDGWTLALPGSLTVSAPVPIAVSPNGREVAFVARNTQGRAFLWIRSLGTFAPRILPGTDEASSPFWSPDNRSLAFFAGGQLKKIDVSGGPPTVVCAAANDIRGGSWGRNGTIIFAPGASLAQPLPTGLLKVPATGGVPASATVLAEGETAHVSPAFLTDGRHFLYRALRAGDAGPGPVYLASLDSTGRTQLLSATSTNIAFTPGYLLFVREGTLMAQPFDARGAVTGEALPVVDHISAWGTPPMGLFAASEGDVLVYRTASARGDSQLTWFDRAGNSLGVLGDLAPYGDVELSPDGSRAAATILDATLGTRDLWVFDVARGIRTRLTSDRAEDNTPVWSPDGRQIVFDSFRTGPLELYQKQSDAASSEQVLLADKRNKFPASWSPDGRFIMYMVDNGEPSGWDLWTLALFGDRKPVPFLQTPFNEVQGQFSPGGRWVAYVSNESGRYEVYVRPFVGSGRTQVSTGGGQWPRWRHDAQEIFYLAPDNKLMAAPVNGQGATFEITAARALFDASAQGPRWSYSPSPDGQRFLVNAFSERSTVTSSPYAVSPVELAPIAVVVNWTRDVKR